MLWHLIACHQIVIVFNNGKVDIPSAFFVQKTLFYCAQMPQDANLQHPQPKRIKIDKQGDVEVNMEENVPHHL